MGICAGVPGDCQPYRDLSAGIGNRECPALPIGERWLVIGHPGPALYLHNGIAGELFSGRLYLTEVGRIDLGSAATVPTRFLTPELLSDKLEPGLSFKLWDVHYSAEGTELTSHSRPADP